MGILNTSPQTPAQLTATRITNDIRRAYNQMIQVFNTSSRLIWNNTQASPEEMFTAFGTDAAQLFVMSGAIITLANTVAGVSLPSPVPPNYSFTINNDGSVTLSQTSSSSSSSS